LTCCNAVPDDPDKMARMTATPNAASSLIRLLLAVLMIVGVIGLKPIAAGNAWTMDGIHSIQDPSTHDCCDPEPAAQPDENCGSSCAQIRCGWTMIPVLAAWLAVPERRPIRWLTIVILPDDVSPETITPPPRA
jgi:hypothetical protein